MMTHCVVLFLKRVVHSEMTNHTINSRQIGIPRGQTRPMEACFLIGYGSAACDKSQREAALLSLLFRPTQGLTRLTPRQTPDKIIFRTITSSDLCRESARLSRVWTPLLDQNLWMISFPINHTKHELKFFFLKQIKSADWRMACTADVKSAWILLFFYQSRREFLKLIHAHQDEARFSPNATMYTSMLCVNWFGQNKKGKQRNLNHGITT